MTLWPFFMDIHKLRLNDSRRQLYQIKNRMYYSVTALVAHPKRNNYSALQRHSDNGHSDCR